MVDFYLINKITGERIIPAFVLMNRGDNYKPIAQYTGTVIVPSPIEGDFSDPAYGTEDIPELPRTRYNYLTDHNKNITTLTDTAGTPLITYQYDAYGNLLNTLTAFHQTLNPFRFSSEYYDHELDLIYYNYRHYNPKDGRWLSKDPIKELGGINLYSFTENCPVNNYDKLGLYVKIYEEDPDKLTLYPQAVGTVNDFGGVMKDNYGALCTPNAKVKRESLKVIKETNSDGLDSYRFTLDGELRILLSYKEDPFVKDPFAPKEFNTHALHERHHAKIAKTIWNNYAVTENLAENLRFCTEECARQFAYAIYSAGQYAEVLVYYENTLWDVEQISWKLVAANRNKNETYIKHYTKAKQNYENLLELYKKELILRDKSIDFSVNKYFDMKCKCWHVLSHYYNDDPDTFCPKNKKYFVDDPSVPISNI